MPVNKAALIGATIGILGAGSMAYHLQMAKKQDLPQSRAAEMAFEKQVSALQAFQPPEKIPGDAVIIDEKERKLSLSDFKGKLIVLNFWATWCAPCVSELPSLAKLQKSRPDLHILAVSQDLERDSKNLKDFLNANQAGNLALYLKSPELKKLLPYRGLPTTYILSKKGKILYKIEGDTDWSSHITLDFIDYVMKSQD